MIYDGTCNISDSAVNTLHLTMHSLEIYLRYASNYLNVTIVMCCTITIICSMMGVVKVVIFQGDKWLLRKLYWIPNMHQLCIC